jgi:hypothetical protein
MAPLETILFAPSGYQQGTPADFTGQGIEESCRSVPAESRAIKPDPPAAFSASYEQPPEKTEAPDPHAVGPRRSPGR